MSVAVMSSKGQIVIPVKLRRQAELTAGDRVVIDFDEATNELRLRKAESIAQVIDQFSAKVASWVKPGTVPLEDPRALYQTREPRG